MKQKLNLIIVGEFVIGERMKSSKYGNPKHKVVIKSNDDRYYIFETKTNSLVGYTIMNFYRKKDVKFHITRAYNKLVIERVTLM